MAKKETFSSIIRDFFKRITRDTINPVEVESVLWGTEGLLTPEEEKDIRTGDISIEDAKKMLSERRVRKDKLSDYFLDGLLTFAESTSIMRGDISIFDGEALVKTRIRQKQKIQEQKSKEIVDKKNHSKSKLKKCQGPFVLDTCIWENGEYTDFFDIIFKTCAEYQQKICILPDIYCEILNHAISIDKEEQMRARIAKKTIEQAIDRGVAYIVGELPKNSHHKNNVYADHAIINFVKEMQSKHCSCTIITDDRDLRIKLKNEQNKDSINSDKIIYIYSVEDLYENSFKVGEHNGSPKTFTQAQNNKAAIDKEPTFEEMMAQVREYYKNL